MSTFFSVEVVPGKLTPYVPPPMNALLHLSQATLSLDASTGERVGVTAKVEEDGPDALICSLREGASESQRLDLIFDSYAEFKVVGNASVHLSGYYLPENDEDDYDEDEEDEDEDEDEEDDEEDEELGNITAADLRALAAYGRKHGLPAVDDNEDDEDDEDDDEDDDDEEDDEDDEEAVQNTVVIKELNHDGFEKADEDEEDDEDYDEDEDDEEDDEDIAIELEAEDAELAPGGGVQIDGDIAPATAVTTEAPGKRKSGAAEKPVSKKAKKNADIAKAVADDLIMQAMEEDDDEGEEPEKDADDIVDVAAAIAGPTVEDVTAPGAANAPEVVEAKAAEEKPLSKKEKKRRAKEAAATGQITVEAGEPGSKSVPIKHTRPKVQKFDNGFIIEDTHMGPAQGKEARPGNKVGVRYKGWLAKTNKVFDQTKGSKTFNFRVGVGEVIKGWDRGVVGMRPGDKRRLTVPPQMAYGTSGVSGAIPGNATLVFDVELVDVKGK